jgi:hypothetical protein
MGMANAEIMRDEGLAGNNNGAGSQRLRNPFGSMFPDKKVHPVELALINANMATTMDPSCYTSNFFKRQRKTVVGYFAPQFKRMVSTSFRVIDFIHAETHPNSLFDPDRVPSMDINKEAAAKAVGLLEAFSESFVRDTPDFVQERIGKQQHIFDNHYRTLDREVCLSELHRAIETDCFERFVPLFIRAFKSMEKQLLAVRQSRKLLFKADTCNQPGCYIDIEPYRAARCYDPIDWGKTKPDFSATDG